MNWRYQHTYTNGCWICSKRNGPKECARLLVGPWDLPAFATLKIDDSRIERYPWETLLSHENPQHPPISCNSWRKQLLTTTSPQPVPTILRIFETSSKQALAELLYISCRIEPDMVTGHLAFALLPHGWKTDWTASIKWRVLSALGKQDCVVKAIHVIQTTELFLPYINFKSPLFCLVHLNSIILLFPSFSYLFPILSHRAGCVFATTSGQESGWLQQ